MSSCSSRVFSDSIEYWLFAIKVVRSFLVFVAVTLTFVKSVFVIKASLFLASNWDFVNSAILSELSNEFFVETAFEIDRFKVVFVVPPVPIAELRFDRTVDASPEETTTSLNVWITTPSLALE